MPIWTEQQLDAAIAANQIGFITLDMNRPGFPGGSNF